ncbi:hypothetical protein Avbf_10876 [Armadillidium vulgare]|nr:hypothetical protein Avbf_10876 [Armadillidium vulgare]
MYNNSLNGLMVSCGTGANILHLKSSCKRFSNLAEIKLITSGLYLLPIDEENLALKKHRLPEASLRSIFQKEKISWAMHCQDIKRVTWGRSTHLVKSGVEFPNRKHPRIFNFEPLGKKHKNFKIGIKLI